MDVTSSPPSSPDIGPLDIPASADSGALIRPFEGDEDCSRKRQRLSSSESSPARSIEVVDGSTEQSPIYLNSTTTMTYSVKDDSSVAEISPREPTSPDQTSSKITLNLKQKSALQQQDQFMSSRVRQPSPSNSALSSPGSPRIIVVEDDEWDVEALEPGVAIIDGGDDIGFYEDYVDSFPRPGRAPSSPAESLRKFIYHWQYDDTISLDWIIALREWISDYLARAPRQPSLWFTQYHKHEEFWDLFPELINALNSRTWFPPWLKEDEGRQALSSCFQHFARLTAHRVGLEARGILQSKTQHEKDRILEMVSKNFLTTYSQLAGRGTGIKLASNLERYFSWNWDEECLVMSRQFVMGGGTISNLTIITEACYGSIQRVPILIDTIAAIAILVRTAYSYADRGMKNHMHLSDPRLQNFYEQTIIQSHTYVEKTSRCLDSLIDERLTLLTVDAVVPQIKCLTELWIGHFQSDESIDQQLTNNYTKQYPLMSVDHRCVTAAVDWQFRTLRKLLISGQMQLRVCAVTMVCETLLFYHGRISKLQDRPITTHPLLQAMAHLILELKLVDYIVGIGSHPEIIIESANMVGFLLVTHTYTDKQSDMIWNTIKNSQNPQVVEATIRMTSACVGMQAGHDLLYICTKLHTLPLASFTSTMRELCTGVFRALIQLRNRPDSHESSIDSPPYTLLIRLIRDSSAISGEDLGTLSTLQHFAIDSLKELVKWGPSMDHRRAICISCLADVAQKAPTAAGSIGALFVVSTAPKNRGELLPWLLEKHDLADLVVTELEASCTTIQPKAGAADVNGPLHQARRDFLQLIILSQPAALGAQLGQKLWNTLVGSPKVRLADRETAWQMLLIVAQKAGSANEFVDRCFRLYLPKLDKMCYCKGTLIFARIAAQESIARFTYSTIDTNSEAYENTLEVIWQMVLTAPPDTIEKDAIKLLAQLYLDDATTCFLSEEHKIKTNLQVIRRCLNQLASSAHNTCKHNEGSEQSNPDQEEALSTDGILERSNWDLYFSRSLMLLKEFLRIHRAQEPEDHVSRCPVISQATPTELLGELTDIRYETFDGHSPGVMSTIQIGLSNSLETFYTIIAQKTGFTSFRMWYAGKQIEYTKSLLSTTIGELCLHTHLVLVRADNALADDKLSAFPTLTAELDAHFENFWMYLGLNDRIAKQIYEFLVTFPTHQKVFDVFEKCAAHKDEIFVVGQPYKSMYIVHTLRDQLSTSIQNKHLTASTFLDAADTLVLAIKRSDLFEVCTDANLRALLLQQFSECLNQLLKSVPSQITDVASFDEAFFLRITHLLDSIQGTTFTHEALVISLFELLLQSCRYSQICLSAFRIYIGREDVLAGMLLQNDRVSLRKAVAKLIEETCEFEQGTHATTIEIMRIFWDSLVGLVSSLSQHAHRSKEFLSALYSVARRMMAAVGMSQSTLQMLLVQWGTLLGNVDVTQNIATPNRPDPLVVGLATLVRWCSAELQNPCSDTASRRIALLLMDRHLFPEHSSFDTDSSPSETMPVLHSQTRSFMYDIMTNLTKNDTKGISAIMRRLSNLLPYDASSSDSPYVYDIPFGFDRSKAIRSSSGYVGLRNLSNTCYLNSLVAQLFMNVTFRRKMLDLRIVDETDSQKLLCETQGLFSSMQNTCRRFVEPYAFVMAIRTYDETSIDVNVQMDVDEFYNLLFDRWESEVLSSDDKESFRSIYGGQLVQQVKSEECPHISERLEPFSAIQCDIKGKSTLQESLQAYVDGEVMEGDNKYKCSSCDKHVNAVKRACLKVIPDNLIFHLKRFDFSLRTLQRNKINDYFAFPHVIDMRPYKVEYLMNEGEHVEEDNFELVGILVHSGTAESGHYYSFIRERPSTSGAWFEFNDDAVNPFDPNMISSYCFGGAEAPDPKGDISPFEKQWSAYMLFYERSSSIKRKEKALVQSAQSTPIRVEIPDIFARAVADENEILMRRHALYDDTHAPFVLRMWDNLEIANPTKCSEDHHAEQQSMKATLLHFDQVVTRKRDTPDFTTYIDHINRRIKDCAECSVDVATWICEHKDALKMLLLKNPDSTIRDATRTIVINSLKRIKSGSANYAYGSHVDVHDEGDDHKLLPRLVDVLLQLWAIIHTVTRAWPEYFALLTDLIALGTAETGQLLDAGFLRHVLDLIRADASDEKIEPQYARMLQNFAKRGATARPVMYEDAIEFLRQFLMLCNLGEVVRSDKLRCGTVVDGGKYPLNRQEEQRLVLSWAIDKVNILVAGLLRIDQNEDGTQEIIKILLNRLPGVNEGIANAVIVGLRDSDAASSSQYLISAITYYEQSSSADAVNKLQRIVATIAAAPGNSECLRYIRYFVRVSEITSCKCGMSIRQLQQRTIELIPAWAPSFLMQSQSLIRDKVADHLRDMLFNHDRVLSDDGPDDVRVSHEVILKTIRLLGIQCCKYLRDHYITPRVQIAKSNVTAIQEIIRQCKEYYEDDDVTMSETSRMFHQLNDDATGHLDELVVDDEEDNDSEWDHGSEVTGSDDILDDHNANEYFSAF